MVVHEDMASMLAVLLSADILIMSISAFGTALTERQPSHASYGRGGTKTS